jgi:hypothetical protein
MSAMNRTLAFAFPLTLLASASVSAQGGPPMMTDDPGTPGSRTWEINTGWNAQSTPGSVIHSLPIVDANYGIGNRVEITYQVPFGVVVSGGRTQAAMGNSEISIKWRFVDAGDWQISMYPGIDILTPGSHADIPGLTDSARTLELPLQIERSVGPVSINGDIGRTFSTDPGDDEWFGGAAVGGNVRRGWELVTEVHVNASRRLQRAEWVAQAGTRVDVSERLTLMFAYGRDVRNDFVPRTLLLAYAGTQLRIGKGPKKAGSRSGRHS